MKRTTGRFFTSARFCIFFSENNAAGFSYLFFRKKPGTPACHGNQRIFVDGSFKVEKEEVRIALTDKPFNPDAVLYYIARFRQSPVKPYFRIEQPVVSFSLNG